MYCNKCGTANEVDAMFCKHCGNNLIDDYINKDKKVNNKNQKIKNNQKVINKNKVKKINKTKRINKVKTKKGKQKNNNEIKVIKKMTVFQKIMFVLLIMIVITLIGVIAIIGLFAADKYTKEVPYLVGMTYEEAKDKLESLDLTASKKEISGEDGIVLEQNKKDGTRVINGTNIILYVGTNDDTLPNLVGLSKDAAISIIEKYNIKYEINIIDSDKEGVISQNYKKNTKIKDIDILKLEVGVVNLEEKQTIEENTEIEESSL